VATALDLITTALKEINVLAIGEPLAAEDAADGLAALNRMVDQWSTERLLVYAMNRTTWPIVSGTGTYTVGTGGSVNIPRPIYIDAVAFLDTSPTLPTEYPLSQLTDAAREGTVLKTITSPFPTCWYYDPFFPLAALVLWPTPTSTTLQGVIYYPQVVTQFATLATTVAMPPGYEEMLVTGLAIALAGPYTRQVDPSLRERAINAKALCKRANARLVDLSFDAGSLVGNGGGLFNIYTGP
jgi:hypothetical protein